MTKNKGFTLIEILIVITLTVILFGIGLAQYMNFNRLQILEQAAQELKNNLRLAQTKAANGEKPDGCGVLNGYRVSFFSGDPYTYTIQAICGGNPAGAVKTFSLPSVVEISSLPPPIIFKFLYQGTDLNTDLTIALVFKNTSLQKLVKVSKNGKIE